MNPSLIARIERYRVYVLVFIVVALPLVLWPPGADPFNVPKLALLFAGAAAAIGLSCVIWLERGSWRGATALAVPAGAFSSGLLIAWIFSAYRGWSLLGEYARFQGLLPYLASIVLGVAVA